MLDTGSVFDVLASDDSDRRLAQRKALVLAETRLDNTLGRFLRAAVTEEEFGARMAACRDDFGRHVAEACAEVGHEDPAGIAKVLTSSYLRSRRWQPKHAFGTPQVHYDGLAYPDAGNEDAHLGPPNFPHGDPNVPGNCPSCGSPNVDENAQTCMDCGFNGNPGHRYEGDRGYLARTAGDDPHWIEHGDKHPGALHRELGVPEGEKIPEDKLEGALHSDNKKERERAQYAENVKKVRKGQDIGKEVDPAEEQDSNDGKGVNEPHQDDEDAKAPKIKSSAEIRNPLNNSCADCGSRVDRSSDYGSKPGQPDQILCSTCNAQGQSKAAADGNTDLGGPEPKMDKRLWEPSNLGDPEIADGRWPTERKDMTEPIGPPNNEHELSEIGEKFTEHQSLPSETENSGFQSGGPGPAPHTDTFGGDGQASPVTRETQPE